MIEIIIKSLLTGWIITRFVPFQMFIEALPDNHKKPIVNLIMNMIKLLFSCSKCTTFWMSLVLFHNIWLAILSSFIMVMYEKTIGKWEKEVEF